MLIATSPSSGLLRTSTNYGLQTDASAHGGDKSTSTNYILRQGTAGQLGSVGKSDSANYSARQGYIYTTNTKPATPETLQQFKSDGATAIPHPAGWTSTSTEILKANIYDYDPGDILTPQVEVRQAGAGFTGEISYEGSNVNYSGTTVTSSVSATGMTHNRSYIWQIRAKDQENYYSDWQTLAGSPSDYRTDFVAPGTSEVLTAAATPEPSPTQVYLTWEAASDALSGIAGYNLYRSTTPGSGYVKIVSLISGLTTTDATVYLGADYYYVIKAEDAAGGESEISRQASAPYIAVTREAVITAPTVGGYTGGAADPVPGSTLKYTMYYTNRGFAQSTGVVIVDKVPAFTQFKIGSATGNDISAVQYSNNGGTTFSYTPSGTYIDANVTHVKWLCNNISSGATKQVEFSVVIR
ncbi:MAG: hypothetical protein WC645_07215 [Candidatus Margulisiibacteriota bacterium]